MSHTGIACGLTLGTETVPGNESASPHHIGGRRRCCRPGERYLSAIYRGGNLADTASDRDDPLVTAVGLPVNGGDGGTGKIEPAFEVVIEKRLNQAVAVGVTLLVISERPDIVDQNPIDPGGTLLKVQYNPRGTGTPFVVAKVFVVIGGKLYDRTGPPDPLAGVGGRKKGGEDRIPDTVGPVI